MSRGKRFTLLASALCVVGMSGLLYYALQPYRWDLREAPSMNGMRWNPAWGSELRRTHTQIDVLLPRGVHINERVQSVEVSQKDGKLTELRIAVGPKNKQDLFVFVDQLIADLAIGLGSDNNVPAGHLRLSDWYTGKGSDTAPVFLGPAQLNGGGIEVQIRSIGGEDAAWLAIVTWRWH